MTASIPILKIEDFLIASIQTSLDDRAVIQFQNDLLEKVAQTGALGVIVDITAVEIVDSFLARSLNDIAIAVHLLGTKMTIVGMRPSVAITLVEMGLSIPNAITALNLDKGLRMMREQAVADKKKLENRKNGDGEEKREDRD